jgi:thiamine-phosphate pyrophosphorylase
MTLDIGLYAIVDPQIARGRSLADLAATAARAGATLIQYRSKDAPTRVMIDEATAIRAALAATGVPLLINDRVDVALAAEAQGVHLGRDDMSVATARKLLGPRAIIGATIKDEADVRALTGAPLDYGCIGGVFATAHKNNTDRPLGLAGYAALRDYARRHLGSCPIGAIAGIDMAQVPDLFATGADGVAVIGAVFASDDVTANTRTLRQAVDAARAHRGAAT